MKIEMYSKKNCSYCYSARKILSENNIEFTEYKLTEDFTREQLLEKVPLAKTYPVILVDDNFIGGFSDLKQLLENKNVIWKRHSS